MEKIVFSKVGPIDKFIEWVDRFKGEISKDSLIIEIDPISKMFISKTYSQDKSLVRYSQISFESACLSLDKQPDSLNSRVLIGIFMILPKFIEALKTFATSDKFTMEISYNSVDVSGVSQYCANEVQFKSKKLKLRVPGSSLNATEMTPLSDEVFTKAVWVAPNPVSIKLSGDELKNLVSISDIFSQSDKLKNFMEFYTTTKGGKKLMFVRDPGQGSYDYELGEYTSDGEIENDIKIPIYRERFLLAVKNAFADTTITISSTTPNRVLIQLGEGDTKTIIAKVNIPESE